MARVIAGGFISLTGMMIAGVAIASGWQATVAYVNVGAYYFIGLPIGCVLGFKTGLGVAVSLPPPSFPLSGQIMGVCVMRSGFFLEQGIWWGMIVGVFVQTVMLILMTMRTNWDREVNTQSLSLSL